jgi:Ca2+-binding EF-hand superfamily protein
MNKTKIVLAISILSLGGTIGVASARQDRAGNRAEARERFDTNRDGKLDDAERAEMHKAMAARHAEHHKKVLAQFDANRDGKLDEAERQKMMEQKAAEHFAKLDTNRDGQLSLAEFKAGAKLRHKIIMRGPGGPGGPGRPGGPGPDWHGAPPAGADVFIHHIDDEGDEDEE